MHYTSEEPKLARPRYNFVAAIVTTTIAGIRFICIVEGRDESIIKPPSTSSKKGRTLERDADSFTKIGQSTLVIGGLEGMRTHHSNPKSRAPVK